MVGQRDLALGVTDEHTVGDRADRCLKLGGVGGRDLDQVLDAPPRVDRLGDIGGQQQQVARLGAALQRQDRTAPETLTQATVADLPRGWFSWICFLARAFM